MSIRKRLFLATSLLILFFVAFSWLLNSQYLGKYYLSQKKASLIKSKQLIERIYHANSESLALELESLERNRGMNISILSKDNEIKYDSSFRGFAQDKERRPFEGPVLMHPIRDMLNDLAVGEEISTVMKDPRLKTEFLLLASRLNNGDVLVLSTPLTAISESTAIANRFNLFTGILTMLLGGIAVYLYANRLTKPILELNKLAQGMAKLDFSIKYPVQSQDEVGQLGSSINSLSDQLDKAITELTEANAKLKQDIERERSLDKMRKEFVSSVSHELKTPLALIQGYAEGLKLNVNEDEEGRNFYCEVIMDETDKMNRLVRDLLDLSHIESGTFKLEKSNFNLSDLVDFLLDKYRPILAEKAIELRVEKAENITVNADYVRIEQVLVNYLNNAINHLDEHKKVKLIITNRQGKVRVAVYNSGPTIPEAELAKIWTSFYKVDKARTRAYGGTGLGLSVVKSVLELHGNTYGVANQADGVVFWFELDSDSLSAV